MSRLGQALENDAILTEKALIEYLSPEDKKYAHLFEAMRYGVLGAGKRVRPFLAIEVCNMLGGKAEDVMPFACALELIHSYSLVHDDMPCMDNDVLRRGKPSMHVKYGEANALLCGDSLLTKAFEVASHADCDAETTVKAIRALADAAGAFGMVGGQQMDLDDEGVSISLDDMRYLHSMKTGALIRCACMLGAICAKCTDEKEITALGVYAANIGITFQIVDDILDKIGDEATFGKSIGSDAEQNKTTYLSFMSVEEAYAEAKKLTEEAKNAISGFENSDILCDFADWLYNRKK